MKLPSDGDQKSNALNPWKRCLHAVKFVATDITHLSIHGVVAASLRHKVKYIYIATPRVVVICPHPKMGILASKRRKRGRKRKREREREREASLVNHAS